MWASAEPAGDPATSRKDMVPRSLALTHSLSLSLSLSLSVSPAAGTIRFTVLNRTVHTLYCSTCTLFVLLMGHDTPCGYIFYMLFYIYTPAYVLVMTRQRSFGLLPFQNILQEAGASTFSILHS